MLCKNCSTENPSGSRFCRKCGSTLNNPKAGDTNPLPVSQKAGNIISRLWHSIKDAPTTSLPKQDARTATGLSINISIALCYLWLWISGIVMLIIERRNRTVCFHACQSIIIFGVLTIIFVLLLLLPPVPYGIIYFFLLGVWVVLIAVGAYLWILMLFKSFTGRPYTLPLIGKTAFKLAAWYQGKLSLEGQTLAALNGTESNQDVAIKYCIVCGKVIPQKAVFCPECGERQLQEVMQQMNELGRTFESERAGDVSSRVNTAIRKALDSTVNAVTLIGEKRDPYTAGHQRRVTALALAIAHDMNLSQQQTDGLNVAGQLHDIGKIAIPSDLLNKPGKLSDGEMIVIRGHSQVSYDILKGIDFPWPVAQIAYQHHERLNGTGYPRGLKGKEIMLEAKILCVADVVEAMASHRPYRPALGIDKALDEIVKNKGKLYDADVVDSCVRLFKEQRFSFD